MLFLNLYVNREFFCEKETEKRSSSGLVKEIEFLFIYKMIKQQYTTSGERLHEQHRYVKNQLPSDMSQQSLLQREGIQYALAANSNNSKHYDGSLRMNATTSYENRQNKKMASLKQQLNKLNTNTIRCQSGLTDSSVASFTAATTSYLPQNSSVASRKQAHYGQRHYSNNINNLCETQPAELTRFSQNSHSKEQIHGYESSILNNQQRRQHQKLGGAIVSAIQPSRKQVMLGGADELRHAQNNRRSSSRDLGNRCRSAGSIKSQKSSPERLVNIVCPQTQGHRKKLLKNQSKGGAFTGKTRPRSDMRQIIRPMDNMANRCANHSAKRESHSGCSERIGIKQQMRTFSEAPRQYGSFNSATRLKSSSKGLCLGNFNKHRPVITPLKSRRSASSLSMTRSKSRSNSHLNHQEKNMGLVNNRRNFIALCETESRSKLSTTGKKISHNEKKRDHQRIQKWVKKSLSRSQLGKVTPSSRHSHRSRSAAKSTARSMSSNRAKILSEQMKKEQSHTKNRYLNNQYKNGPFDSIKAENSNEKEVQNRTQVINGQLTGKFRSLNEPMINQMAQKQRYSNLAQNQQQSVQGVAFNLDMADDNYCETLTASSDDSPMRPSQRVEKATMLTKQAYMQDIKYRVQDAGLKSQSSVAQFGPRKMKAAYQGINARQSGRLYQLKQQMQESLVESHQLQTKLQSSGIDPSGGNHCNNNVSQFNNLVLDFSKNLEVMASEMIEHTESKRRDAHMREMLTDMQQMRRLRSASNSDRVSKSRSRRSRSTPRKRSKSARKKMRRSRSNLSMRRSSGSLKSNRSIQSNRSKKSNLSKKRKRSKSASKMSSKRSKTKSKRRGNSSAKSESRNRSVASCHSFMSATGGKSNADSNKSQNRMRLSRPRKRIKSVKRNIFVQTNGFRDVSKSDNSPRSRSRGGKRPRSKSRKSSASAGKLKLSSNTFSRARELGKMCTKIMTPATMKNVSKTALPIKRKRSLKIGRSKSKTKTNMKTKSKSRSKSVNKKKTKRSTKSRSKSKSKSARRSDRASSKSPSFPILQEQSQDDVRQMTPCMTPLHKILRNSMGDHNNSHMSSRMNRFGSYANQNKKVKIMSRRLEDISQLTSSDSSSGSEDSLGHEQYMRRQQAHLSPWQRACVRKHLPKKFR